MRGRMICFAFVAALAAQSEEEFHRFLRTHCVACHADRTRKGGVRLDPPAPSDRKRVLDALQEDVMPPKSRPRPPRADREAIVGWLTGQLSAAEELRPRTVLRRLN